jgi:hypothetical protein
MTSRGPSGAALALAVAAGLHVAAAGQGVERADRPDRLERPFAKGGRVTMDLSAGAYTIRGGSVESIRVRWKTEDPRDMGAVRTEVAVNGANATLRTRGPKNNFRVEIDVPALTDIYLDLSAGDLTFRGVEGNKRVSMWAGEVTMEVGDPQLYKHVDVTVRAGEIQAAPFGGSRGGLMRSFRWNGGGKYSIIAKLFAGEVRLVK